jgi:threonine dehydratase
LALAYHGKRLGIPVTVVMPTIAPLTKVQRCMLYKAVVHVRGGDIYAAYDFAQQLAQTHGFTYINGFNDHGIIAGAGTAGLEIIEQVEGNC